MNPAEYRPSDLDEVRQRELERIQARRQVAGVQGASRTLDEVAATLVGVSLSGGGIRSASFNLGLLQALYRHGLLRYVDYLSTVSGGSYVAARLASEVCHPETRIDWDLAPERRAEPVVVDASAEGVPAAMARGRADRGARNGSGGPVVGDDRPAHPGHGGFALAEGPDGRQPPQVLEMIRGGRYLGRSPLQGINRWLIGIVLIGGVTITGLVGLASAAAWLFRWLDTPWMFHRLYVLGFRSDVHRALFPACVLFLVWVLVWAIAYWRRGPLVTGSAARPWLSLTLVALLMGVAALLGTGDIDLSYLRDLFGIRPPEREVGRVQSWLLYLMPPIVMFALLPYLRPRELLRSGTHPRNRAESWIFAMASRALVFGIPLLIFGALARENLSGFNEDRLARDAYLQGLKVPARYDLLSSDFRDFTATWRAIEAEAVAAAGRPAGALPTSSRHALSLKLWQAVQGPIDEPTLQRLLGGDLDVLRRDLQLGRITPKQFANPLQLALHGQRQVVRIDRTLWRWDRAVQLLSYVVIQRPNDVTDQLRYRGLTRRLQDYVGEQVNQHVLRDPALYQIVPGRAKFLSAAEDRQRFDSQIGALWQEGPDLLAVIAARQPAFDRWIERRRQVVEATLMGRVSDAQLRAWLGGDPGLNGLGRAELIRRVNEAIPDQPTPGSESQSSEVLWAEQALTGLNWTLLSLCYPEALYDRATVFAYVTLSADQTTRAWWLAGSLALFLIGASLVNLNASSMHGFYRDQLAAMWVRPRPGTGRNQPLVQLDTTSKGAPYTLLGATLSQLRNDQTRAKSPEDVFVFSFLYCGSIRTGFMPTERFRGGDYDLANAMAVSGAALSPTYPSNPLVAMLLLLTNLRLGQWLPNPAFASPGRLRGAVRRSLDRLPAVPLRLLVDHLAGRSRGPDQELDARSFCFVADGGYVENLGLEQLLLRRCRLIVVSDASSDPDSTFDQLLEVIQRVRNERGIRVVGLDDDPRTAEPEGLRRLIPQRPAQLAPDASTRRWYAADHVVIAEIHYPPEPGVTPAGAADEPAADGLTGWLIVVKPTLTLDEGAELLSYWAKHPEFPHDRTSDQLFPEDKFDAYRRLGSHIGERLVRVLKDPEAALGPNAREMVRALRSGLLVDL